MMVDFSDIHTKMKWMAESGRNLSRFGIADAAGKILYEECGVCFQGLVYQLQNDKVGKTKYVFTTWNGEATNCDQNIGRGRDYPYQRRSQFSSGPLSDRWLEYLLSPISPWKSLHPHIVNRDDVESIRHGGGMIIDLSHPDLTFSQVYNFLITTRWSYEFNHKASFWAEMVDTGVHPTIAFLIALAFSREAEVKRELVREAGYRKERNDKGREVYIKDHWGNKQWFEAEYKELGRVVTDKLVSLWGENHEPLHSLNAVCYRVFHSEPNLVECEQALKGKTAGRRGAWSIWDGKTDHRAAVEALRNKTLAEAIKVVSEISQKL